MCAVLAPWQTQGEKFLFMYDRSIVCNTMDELEADLTGTNEFDTETGAEENVSKRQVWRRGDRKEIEHIGIVAMPDDEEHPIVPAAGWGKLKKVLERIRSIPGPASTRLRAVMVYARPLWAWGVPSLFDCAPPWAPALVMKKRAANRMYMEV